MNELYLFDESFQNDSVVKYDEHLLQHKLGGGVTSTSIINPAPLRNFSYQGLFTKDKYFKAIHKLKALALSNEPFKIINPEDDELIVVKLTSHPAITRVNKDVWKIEFEAKEYRG